MQDKINDIYNAVLDKNPSRWKGPGFLGFEQYYFGYDFMGPLPESRSFSRYYDLNFEREDTGWRIVGAE